jgi:hypothetical protein
MEEPVPVVGVEALAVAGRRSRDEVAAAGISHVAASAGDQSRPWATNDVTSRRASPVVRDCHCDV